MQNNFEVEIKVPKEKALHILDEQIAQGEKYYNKTDYTGRNAWNQRNRVVFTLIFKNTSATKSYPTSFNGFSEGDLKACVDYLQLLRSLVDILPDEEQKVNIQVNKPATPKTGSTGNRTKREETKYEANVISETSQPSPPFSYSVFGTPNKKYTYDLFVLMPFTESLKPVYDHLFKKVAKTLNLTIARADDFFSQNSIMQHEIWSAINLASIIIADCTGKNPNVFYEIGIAHTIGKPVILVTQNQDDVPFDLRHIRYIKYQLTKTEIIKFEYTLTTTIVEIIKDIGGSKNK